MTIHIIDCTLRDGGYYNSWDFDQALIAEYLAAMDAAGVDYVEIGFRSFDRVGFKGPCAYSTDDFIASLPVAPDQKIGVMVNAAEVVKHPAGVLEATRMLFRPRTESPVTMARFACHLHEFEQTLPACAWLKEQGYRVGINLMQVADRANEEVEHIGVLAQGYPLDALYFADSLGSMDPAQTSRIIALLRRRWSGAIGIHTHDNMGRAVVNTLRAIEEGATWVDSTVTGMGRGPGNAQTEYVLMELEGKRARAPQMSPLLTLIRQRFGPMQQACGWGKNPYYYLSGKYGIHPTYVQEMLADPRYREAEILAVIEHLRTVGGKKFSVETMEQGRQMYGEAARGSWAPASVLDGRHVLVLGAGPSAMAHASAIESWVRRTRPVVMALNTVSSISLELIDYRVASYPFRLMADAPAYSGMAQPLIAPASRLNEAGGSSVSGLQLLDFGLSVQPGAFAFGEEGAVAPSSLAIAYALAIASSGRATRVLLAGFDGYSADDPRFSEMAELFATYLASDGSVPIESVTPTRYSIPTTSIYAL
jgi:4-hydroxy 2-oxovalerate aldolase